MQGVDLNMVPPVEDLVPPCDTLPIVRSTATCDYQISLIESKGPHSRGVHMLTPPLEPGQPMVSLPLEATKHIHKSNGQFLCMHPKYARSWTVPYQMCVDIHICVEF